MKLNDRWRTAMRYGKIYFPYDSSLFIRYRLYSDLSCRFELCANPILKHKYKAYFLTGITLKKIWLKDRNEANLRTQIYLDNVQDSYQTGGDDSDLNKRVLIKFINTIYVFYKNLLQQIP